MEQMGGLEDAHQKHFVLGTICASPSSLHLFFSRSSSASGAAEAQNFWGGRSWMGLDGIAGIGSINLIFQYLHGCWWMLMDGSCVIGEGPSKKRRGCLIDLKSLANFNLDRSHTPDPCRQAKKPGWPCRHIDMFASQHGDPESTTCGAKVVWCQRSMNLDFIYGTCGFIFQNTIHDSVLSRFFLEL